MTPLPQDPRLKIEQRLAALRAKSERLKEEARILEDKLRHPPQPPRESVKDPKPRS
jgi:hypothetical protein